MIKNNLLNKEIDSSRIVSENNNGIIYTSKKSWYFVPNDQVTKEEQVEDGYFYNVENIANLDKKKSVDNYLNNPNEIEDVYVEKAQYKLCFEILDSYVLEPKKTSAIISKSINLNNFSYITLSVSEELEDVSVEYYIVSGNTETSILPENNIKIEKEKLFYNLPTRFVINQSEQAPILYENDIQIEREYTDLTFKDFESNDYYLTYIVGEDPYKIIPTTSNIKLKIIFRSRSSKAWAKIKNVVINKYGGTLEWN